jgi:hypothetical protein
MGLHDLEYFLGRRVGISDIKNAFDKTVKR